MYSKLAVMDFMVMAVVKNVHFLRMESAVCPSVTAVMIAVTLCLVVNVQLQVIEFSIYNQLSIYSFYLQYLLKLLFLTPIIFNHTFIHCTFKIVRLEKQAHIVNYFVYIQVTVKNVT